jgi:gliding motility-associated-like protein
MMMAKPFFFHRAGLAVMLVMLTMVTQAQDFSRHNWYFGQGTQAIRFSRSDNSAALVTKTPLGLGGSAVASDQTNANLLFYTDGTRVFDISQTQMPNGGGLLGNAASNQPAAICPVPGQPDQYYVFTNTASFTTGGNIVASIVDMNQFGNAVFPAPAAGNVTTKNSNIGLSTGNRSEAMITIPHSNGTDYWLISHQNGTDTYTVTQVQAGGVFSINTISAVTGIPVVAGNFSYHAATGKIAVAPQDADRNVAILDFDNTTGALTLDQFVLNSAISTTQDIYDTEWSHDGRFLYISRNNDVLQYDLNNPLNSLASVLPATVFKSYGIQVAPDSAMYHLYESAAGIYRLGRLQDIDSVANLTRYTSFAFTPPQDFDAKQFPGFSAAQTITPTVTFVTSSLCANNNISFFPTVVPTADSLVWTFGDGGASSQWSPTHLYTAGGTYTVTATPFLNGVAGTPGTQNLNITNFALQISLVQDTTACRCEFPPPIGTTCNGGFSVSATVSGGTPTSAIWSNGDTGLTLTPDSAGYYFLVVTDGSGCSAYAGVNVREYDAIDQRANVWYFGQNAGIDFNQQPAVSVAGPVNSPEGVSVISDRNGEVIFSTDGVRVYDRQDVEITTDVNGNPITVPPGIGGDNGSTQSALIIPVPGDETLYYIFTTQEIDQGRYEVRYSLFDLKENGGDGGIVQFNQLLFSPSTERISGNNNWLIAHEFGNNSFRAYEITPAGISNPVISSIGADHGPSPVSEGQGYMKLGPNNLLAVSYPTTGSNTLELFDFIDSTGVVTNYRIADTQQPAGQVYGIEFAGNKIFATVKSGASSRLVEFYMSYQNQPVLITPTIPAINEELGAIQLGPDGQIYVAVNNKPYLGVIQVNGDTLQTSNITVPGFNLTSGQSRLGLPNFIQSVGSAPQQASMTVTGLCLGIPTDFSATGTDPIDEFLWSFGDGFGANTQVAQHTYAAAGTYLVTLQVTNRCGLDTTITRSITITAPPANPSTGVTICNGAAILDANPGNVPGLTYLWSTGATTETISVSLQGIYTVAVTNAAGCVTNGSILAADNRPIVDLGPDQTLCQNTPVPTLDAFNPGSVFVWTINGVLSGNTQTQTVDTTVPGTFRYIVNVTDPITTCTIADTVTFIIGASPQFTATPSNTTGCGTLTGQIALNITGPIGNLFSYGITGPATNLQGIDQGTGPVAGSPFTGLGAGSYGVSVSDQLSGCTTATIVGISDNTITITGAVAQSPTCSPIAIDVTTTGVTTAATYTITSAGGTVVVPPTNVPSVPVFSTNPVPVPGSYTIQINEAGCVATFDITIAADPALPVVITPDPCNQQLTAQAANGVFDWSNSPVGAISNIDNSVAGQSTLTLNVGTWTLILVATDGTGTNCPVVMSVPITIPGPITADFTQSDACANTVTLTATPTGSFTYRWYDNGVLTPGGSTLVIGQAQNGHTFELEVVSTITGCISNRASHQVFVAGDLQVSFTTTVPCEGSPFTLTGSSNQPGTNFQWGFNGTNIAGAIGTTHQDTRAGVYRLTGSLPGCTRFIDQPVALFPSPVGSLPRRALICNDPANPDCALGTPEPNTCTVTLDAGAGFISYTWFENGVANGETTQTLLVTNPNIYGVELENSFGCIATDETEVIEECKPRIVAPTAFRPGSAVAANATFRVFSFFIEDSGFQLFIYNRWGELIYQSNDRLGHGWNGGYNNNGQLLPAGTYTYVVKYVSRFENGEKEYRGGVVLLR